jgi:hypothetical protein
MRRTSWPHVRVGDSAVALSVEDNILAAMDCKVAAMTVERLAAFGEAWARHDLETLMSFITDDCVYSASVGPEPGATYTGRDDVCRGFRVMLSHDEGWTAEAGEVFVAGDRGVATWAFTRVVEDRTVRVRGCDVFTFRGDRIARKDAYRKLLG